MYILLSGVKTVGAVQTQAHCEEEVLFVPILWQVFVFLALLGGRGTYLSPNSYLFAQYGMSLSQKV
jgi:hypothetical protein